MVEYQLEKAVIAAQKAAQAGAAPVSQFYSPYSLFMGREWLVKSGTPLDFADLRMMAKNPIIGSIIHTRLNQVAAFCHPSLGRYEAGFELDKEGSDPGDDSSSEKAAISQYIDSAGFPGMGDTHLEEWTRKFIRDSLVLDQGCSEIVPRLNGRPGYLVAVDGGTIRRLAASLDYAVAPKTPVYCQVLDEVIVAEYSHEQMIYGVRNPSTDIHRLGYGSSELELLVNVVTIMANAEKYNSSALAQGGTQKGILVVKGAVDGPQLEAFKRDFRNAISNAATAWRPPVLGIGADAEVNWVTLDRANKDMEYAQLFDFILKLATGVYQIAPEEVNWQIGQSGASVTYNSGIGDRLSYSQDKGLRPLLNFLAGHLNNSFVSKIAPGYSLAFTGLGISKGEEAELRLKELGGYKTLNEIRSEANLDPVQGGDLVLNPTYIQALTLGLGGGGVPPGSSEPDTFDESGPQSETAEAGKVVEGEW